MPLGQRRRRHPSLATCEQGVERGDQQVGERRHEARDDGEHDRVDGINTARGEHGTLTTHLARHNPVYEALRAGAEVLVIVTLPGAVVGVAGTAAEPCCVGSPANAVLAMRSVVASTTNTSSAVSTVIHAMTTPNAPN